MDGTLCYLPWGETHVRGIFGGQKGRLRRRYNGHPINHFFLSLLIFFAVKQGLRNNVISMSWEQKWSILLRNWTDNEVWSFIFSSPDRRAICSDTSSTNIAKMATWKVVAAQVHRGDWETRNKRELFVTAALPGLSWLKHGWLISHLKLI